MTMKSKRCYKPLLTTLTLGLALTLPGCNKIATYTVSFETYGGTSYKPVTVKDNQPIDKFLNSALGAPARMPKRVPLSGLLSLYSIRSLSLM